jgi:AcrR family transcriptional regulator
VPAQQRDLRPQGRRTVVQLLDAGVSVFATLGFQAARVEDVVRAANTSHGTFYLYFANKEDLLLALAEHCTEDMNHLADRLGPVGRGPEGRAELRAWIAEFAVTYERHAAVIRAWSEQQVQGPDMAAHGVRAFTQLTARLVARLREAAPGRSRTAGRMAGRPPRPARPAETEAIALLALLERLSYYRMTRGVALLEDEWLDTVATIVHRGFFNGDAAPAKSRRSSAKAGGTRKAAKAAKVEKGSGKGGSAGKAGSGARATKAAKTAKRGARTRRAD